METVQLQCGNCKQLMAISVEHLGGQVQCPHCRSVVQTPPPAAKAPVRAVPALEKTPVAVSDHGNERESIFGEPEVSEDVIGGGFQPHLLMPKESRPTVPNRSESPLDSVPTAETAPAENPQTDLGSFKRNTKYRASVLPLMVMIFLVPYAIVTTLFIVYLLMSSSSRPHPLDLMPDPAPGKKQGAPRQAGSQAVHNLALAAHQKTKLGVPIRLGKDGNLLITPERVVWLQPGDLQLVFRAKNLSPDQAFEPINEFYVRYQPSKEREGGNDSRPYTFLESLSKNIDNIYGGYLEYRKKVQGKEVAVNEYLIAPKEEEIVALRTMENYRAQVASILAKPNETYLWRVQARRGLFKHHGKELSTTAVFGVEFTRDEIEGIPKKT